MSSFEHGVRAINQSKLNSFSIDNQLIQLEFTHSIIGRIDLSKRIFNDQSIFDWDDIFVVEANGMSYHQLKQMGIKNSSRDMVISDFIKQLINLKFDPPPQAKRVIDFSMDVYDYILQNKSFNNPFVIQYGFQNLIKHLLNKGIVFRSANNRRQVNYWSPGLNGGLPLTPKDDQIHQDTFMAHDIGHFAIPDLIFIGNNSIIHKRVYIAWRMISEATTMVIADMLFVDALVKSNINYDFNKRKIYPLFKDLNIDLTNSDTRMIYLKELIKANYKYCLTGDDSLYIQMISNETNSLKEFKEKFSSFFVEDYRWTEHNYENMVQRSEQMSLWWNQMKPFRELQNTESIQSIDDLIEQIQSKYPDVLYEEENEFIDKIFQYVFETKIESILDINQSVNVLEQSKRLFKSFTKWIIGQLAITSKFYFLSESKQVREDILLDLTNLSKNGQMNMNDVTRIRLIYENYLEFLLKKNFISSDDQRTYSEVYPLFDPFYINYDKDANSYEHLSTISSRIYSIQDYRNKQINQLSKFINRPLTTNESFVISTIYHFIESGNGQIIDGMFVKQPGLMLLSESPINHSLGLVTFLISGISIETSLELISHHESKVARLTTSKTNAMNIPLFRVQGDQTLQQRLFIENIIKYHHQFQLINQSRNEFYNMNYPASKITILTYTMNLEDFHKLFLGRIKQSGNEQEVIHITKRMATLLHSKYPQFIQSVDFYLNSNNNQKYLTNNSSIELIDDSSIDSIQLIGKSKLTNEADRLFKRLNILYGNDFQRLAEFRSRLTYLSFSKIHSNENNQKIYLNKILNEHGHLSILDASQAIFQIPKHIQIPHSNLFTFKQTFLFATNKQIRQAILRSSPTDTFYHLLVYLENLIQ